MTRPNDGGMRGWDFSASPIPGLEDYLESQAVLMEGDPCPKCGTPLHVGLDYIECETCGWQDIPKGERAE